MPMPEKDTARADAPRDHMRFLAPHVHLNPVFGGDWFGQRAEGFARFFGTPTFLIVQTLIVAIWIVINIVGWARFDVYPFILLNLAFSLQAAYAAPLILLAQTRQADRDKVHAEADALHREAVARANEQQQELVLRQTQQIMQLIEQNTALTQRIEDLSRHVEQLTIEMHKKLMD